MSGQASLFGVGDAITLDHQRVDLEGGDVVYLRGFFSPQDSDRLLWQLDETTVWRQETFRMYGKEMPIPRLTAWYGDPGRTYTYSKIAMHPEPWTPPLREIKARIEDAAQTEFNSVLLNLYRDGRDSVGWHSDDEPELGPDPVIASVSLGATRKFQMRRTAVKQERGELELTHGSLLLMHGSTQRTWQHQVPKTSRPVDPRVNLTFRTIS